MPKSAKKCQIIYGPMCMISMRAACMYGASGNCGAACIGFKFRHFFQILIFGRFLPKSAKKCQKVPKSAKKCQNALRSTVHDQYESCMHVCASGNCFGACVGSKFPHFFQIFGLWSFHAKKCQKVPKSAEKCQILYGPLCMISMCQR